MQLITLGSGSSGNGYILQSDYEALIIECGMPLKDAIEVLGGNLKKVVCTTFQYLCNQRYFGRKEDKGR